MAVDRRTVLRGGAGAVLAGAAGGTALLQHPAATHTRRPAGVDERAWRELRSAVAGPLFQEADANYWALSPPTNHRYAQVRPSGVLCPDTDADVARAVDWARKFQQPVTPRCGGHSFAGHSTTTGLLVHLARMRGVRVDAGAHTLTVQAGARSREVYLALKDTDLLLPGGRCPAVGVSGLVLGGGIGLATRAHGLTCDNLVRTTVATADGRLVVCDEKRDADLFWACRGGAGGNFGINTSYTFRLHHVPGVTVYDLVWEWKDAAEVLAAADELTGRRGPIARKLTCQYGIRTMGDARVYAQGLYFGPRTDLEQALRPLLDTARPTRTFIEERRIWPAMSYFDDTPSGDPYGTKSIVSGRPLTPGLIGRLVARFDTWQRRSRASRSTVSFFAMGGRDTDPDPADTAFVHRGARFILSMTSYWSDADLDPVRDANLAWLDGLYHDMAADLGTHAYQNFPDGALRQWWTAYYGTNYDRLVEVKHHYDPGRLFRHPQSIRPHPAA